MSTIHDIPGAAYGANAKVWIERSPKGGYFVYYRDPIDFSPDWQTVATWCLTKWGARIAARRVLKRLRAGLEKEVIQ